MNTNIIRSTIELRLHEELRAHADIQRALRCVEGHPAGCGLGEQLKRLLPGAFRLSRTTAPAVLEALAVCQGLLGHDRPVEVFVHRELGRLAAAVVQPGETPAILLSSRLLEMSSETELRFILGHELGHIAFEHFSLPLPALASAWDEPDWKLSHALVYGLYKWSRAAELSADRAGLLCAQDSEAAARALFKLTTGWSLASVKSELQAQTRQVDTLLSFTALPEQARTDEDLLGCFSMRAYSPMRLRGLVAFSRTRTFLRSAGRYASDDGISDDMADTVLARDLKELEASYLEEKSERADLLRKVLTLGTSVGMLPHEGQSETQLPAEESNLRRELLAALVQARQEATLSERARLVHHLTLRATPSGEVHEQDYLKLRRVAVALAVPPSLVDEALHCAACPLD